MNKIKCFIDILGNKYFPYFAYSQLKYDAKWFDSCFENITPGAKKEYKHKATHHETIVNNNPSQVGNFT